MPKLIDHRERDALIARAAWRVLVRDGVPGFSVRRVAEEARLATASLRRAFPTQASLRAYCLRLVAERVQARIDVVAAEAEDARTLVIVCLEQFLPLDAERRTEMEVYLALGSLALTDPAVRVAYDDAHRGMATAFRTLLGTVAGDGVDVDAEAARLHALVDGMAMHLVHGPAGADPGWALEALDRAVPTV